MKTAKQRSNLFLHARPRMLPEAVLRSPDPRPVVDSKLLNVKDDSYIHYIA